MTSLEEQFALLVANVGYQDFRTAPEVLRSALPQRSVRSRTVYSVVEAISQRGQNAKLGAGSNRDTGTRR